MIGCKSVTKSCDPSVLVCDIFDNCKKRKFIKKSEGEDESDRLANIGKAKVPKVFLRKLDPDECPKVPSVDDSCSIRTSIRGTLTESNFMNVVKAEPNCLLESLECAPNPVDIKGSKVEEDKIDGGDEEKMESTCISSDDDDDEDVSEYERMRLKNIKENARFFASLNIFTAKEQLAVAVSGPQKASKPKSNIPKEKKVVTPRKPSLRLRRQGPDGKPLPPKPVIRYIDEVTRREERKPAGPIRMLAKNLPEDIQENSPSQVTEMLNGISFDCSKCAQPQTELQTFCRSFSKMKLTPQRVAKVTKDRVYSVAIHPGKDNVLVCAGDKSGRLGMWNVESKDKETNGILVFEPHSSPVNCLHFAPANPSKIYSSSYDGTLRCGDFEKGVFDEAYSTTLGHDIYTSHFDFLSPDGSKLVVAQNDGQGHIAIVDTRTRCGAENVYRLHDKSIRTVSVHPLKSNYVVTGSKDGTVALWDTRSLKTKGKKNKSIITLNQGRGVTGAYFSPVTGQKLLTTSYNDTLKVYIFSENGAVFLKTTVRHNNFVGRWVTPFRAVWHPSREDVFISGSMERPRRIEVYNDKGIVLKNFMNEECLGSICSINTFHPTRNILVGGNSSGRLHVFM